MVRFLVIQVPNFREILLLPIPKQSITCLCEANNWIEDVNDLLVTASAAAVVNSLDLSSAEITNREIKIWKTRNIPFPKDKNPLDKWRHSTVHPFPWSGVMVRHVPQVAIPATSAATERLFSTAGITPGNVMTKKCWCLTCDNMEESRHSLSPRCVAAGVGVGGQQEDATWRLGWFFWINGTHYLQCLFLSLIFWLWDSIWIIVTMIVTMTVARCQCLSDSESSLFLSLYTYTYTVAGWAVWTSWGRVFVFGCWLLEPSGRLLKPDCSAAAASKSTVMAGS